MQMNKTFESNISSCGGHTLYSWPDALHTSKNTSWESTIAVGPTIGFSKILFLLSGHWTHQVQFYSDTQQIILH